jgi:hypothetical protein
VTLPQKTRGDGAAGEMEVLALRRRPLAWVCGYRLAKGLVVLQLNPEEAFDTSL